MWLNCKRASANEWSGKLETHYWGIVEDHAGTNYHATIGDAPMCDACQKPLALGDLGATIGDRVMHKACCTCTCPTHRDEDAPIIATAPTKQPREEDALALRQLAMF